MIPNIDAIYNLAYKDCQFHVKWRMTNCCNYTCSFCGQGRKDNFQQQLNEDNCKCILTQRTLANILNKLGKTTSLALIGGEVTILELNNILAQLFVATPWIKQLTLTTNFSRPISFYNTLIGLCKGYGVRLSLICSFHDEFCTIDNFIAKLNELDKYEGLSFKGEIVLTKDNESIVTEWISKMDENGFIYKVDSDFTDENFNVKSKNNFKEPNYTIIKNGIGETLATTSLALREEYGVKSYKTDGTFNKNLLNTIGYYCSTDYNYLYIDKDQHVGFVGDSHCRVREPLINFKPLEEPKKCCIGCSLCGYVSIDTDKERLKKFLNSEEE